MTIKNVEIVWEKYKIKNETHFNVTHICIYTCTNVYFDTSNAGIVKLPLPFM